MSLVTLFFALLSSYWLARALSRDALLLSPAITLICWSLFLAIFVSNNVPISRLWWPFWLVTSASAIASFLILRSHWQALKLLIAPAICAAIVLSPYIVHGIGSYPGSWFWDGFAYLATGETLWRYPRDISSEGLEPLYLLGQSKLNSRFTASALLAAFRGILPLGGESDGSAGFLFLACVTTYACSCNYLARRCLPGRLQFPYTVVTSISGSIVNLIWANNLDHLLALSIAPALVGFAVELDWRQTRHACFIGVGAAAVAQIYPEMAPILLLPVGLTLIIRGFREKAPYVKTGLWALAAFAVVIIPLSAFLYKFVIHQIGTVSRPAGLRPGSNYFPTLLDFRCLPGAASGLYAPYQTCSSTLVDILKSSIGLLIGGLVLAGMNARRDAIAISGAVVFAAAMYFVIWEHYDYGAFKLLTSGTHIFTLLMASALAPLTIRKACLGGLVSICLLISTFTRLVQFDKIVPIKSLNTFAELAAAIPDSATVALKISGPLKFQWAAYYLKDRPTVPIEGRFAYLDSTAFDTPFFKDRLPKATFVVTDTTADGDPIWSNSIYRLYKVSQ